MKIGIMTWFKHMNYGTALQAAALNQVVKNMGHAASVINYVPIEPEYGILRKLQYLKINLKIHFAGGRYEIEEKNDRFNQFLDNYLDLSEPCHTEEELKKIGEICEKCICGSDQIWSPLNFDTHYFLDFLDDGKKKIAYAPSFGVNAIDDINVKKSMADLITDFASLSVREQQGKRIISNLCGREADVVMDPTTLLSADEWLEFLHINAKNQDDKYILCYVLGNNEKNWSLVRQIVSNFGLKAKIIPIFNHDLERGYENIGSAGPREFVELISNAELVLTDSFHGLLFSVLFEKAFYVFERFKANETQNQNSRIYNLLSLLGLNSRLISNSKSLKDVQNLDYSVINSKLHSLREQSMEYLKKAIN